MLSGPNRLTVLICHLCNCTVKLILYILHVQGPPFFVPLFKVWLASTPNILEKTLWTNIPFHSSPSHLCVPGVPPATYLKALEVLLWFTFLPVLGPRIQLLQLSPGYVSAEPLVEILLTDKPSGRCHGRGNKEASAVRHFENLMCNILLCTSHLET